jgi:hemoglobin
VETKSLFERLGGTGAISAAVFVFYSKVMADSRIKHFFEGIDMNAQREKQVGPRQKLFCWAGL